MLLFQSWSRRNRKCRGWLGQKFSMYNLTWKKDRPTFYRVTASHLVRTLCKMCFEMNRTQSYQSLYEALSDYSMSQICQWSHWNPLLTHTHKLNHTHMDLRKWMFFLSFFMQIWICKEWNKEVWKLGVTVLLFC